MGNNDVWLIEVLNIKDQSPRRHQEIFKTSNQYAMQIKSGNPAEQKKLLRNFLSRVELYPDKLIIELDINKLGNIIQPDVITTTHATATAWIHRIEVPHRLKRRGVEAKLIIGDDISSRQDRDPHLILLIAKAHHWLNELTTGKATSIHELAEQLNEDRNEISRFLTKALIAHCRSKTDLKTPRFSLLLVSFAKNPYTAFAHEHEVGVKWNIHLG